MLLALARYDSHILLSCTCHAKLCYRRKKKGHYKYDKRNKKKREEENYCGPMDIYNLDKVY